MSIRRLFTLLVAVASVLGLSAIPSAALGRTATVRQAADDQTAGSTDSSADDSDSTDSADDGSADDSSADDGTSDICTTDGNYDGTQVASRDVSDDTSGDPSSSDDTSDDPSDSSDDPSDDSSDDPSDDGADDPTDWTDPCPEDSGDDTAPATAATLSTLLKTNSTGGLDQTINMPGPGTIDDTVTAPTASIASVRHSKARWPILGRAHLRVKSSGPVTLHIKLTARGRRALKKATHKLHLTVRTRIVLASGKHINRTSKITVAPTAKKHRKAHRPHRATRH